MMSQNERINSLPLILQHSSLKFLFNQMGRSIDVVYCFFPQPWKTKKQNKNKPKTNGYIPVYTSSIYIYATSGRLGACIV